MTSGDPVVLGIDTATMVAVGLAAGSRVLATAMIPDNRAHVEQLGPLVDRVLAEASLDLGRIDQLVVGLGPGPFTGLRVGIVTAQVLAATLSVPWRGVCSLDVLAHQWVTAGSPAEFVVATDARRRELYWAHYRSVAGRAQRAAGPQVGPPDLLPDLPVAGPGVLVHRMALGSRVGAGGPKALDPAMLAVRGADLPDAGREPLYLRRPDATIPGPPKSALAAGGPGRLRGLPR